MALEVNARPIQDGLVVNIDPYDRRNGDTGCGGGAFTGHTQGQINTVNGNVSTYLNATRLDHPNLYPITVWTNTYPEGNYGAYGLFNAWNTNSGQVYSFTRALHFYVYVPGEGWLGSSYFNGSRTSGYCYDNYSSNATTENPKFVADYYRIKAAFPKATYVLVGGHAADQYSQEMTEIMVDLGAPSSVLGWDPSPGRPEFVLVGQPGLGAGNAFGWSYENENANRATLNMMLPATVGGDLLFDGTSDYMVVSDPGVGSSNWTIELVVKPTSTSNSPMLVTPNSNGIDQFVRLGSDNSFSVTVCEAADTGGRNIYTPANTVPNGQYTHCTAVNDGRYIKLYINGVLSATLDDIDRIQAGWTGAWYISQRGNSTYYYNGKIGLLRVYREALNANNVLNNFNAVKSRFGI